jgi:hypothetical protein
MARDDVRVIEIVNRVASHTETFHDRPGALIADGGLATISGRPSVAKPNVSAAREPSVA